MLGLAGYAVDVAASERPAPTHWSRFCDGRHSVTDPRRDPARFVEDLERVAAGNEYDVLLPGSDASLLAISRYGERLRVQVTTGLPGREVVERCLSKIALAESAASVNRPGPETVVCQGPGEAVVAARMLGYPVVLKPRSSVFEHHGQLRQRGSVVVADEAELTRRVVEFGTPCLVQRCETGSLISLGGVIADGQLLGAVASRYHRTWRPDAGSAAYSETIALTEELKRTTFDIVRSLGWRGVFELELLERPSGEFLPIDFNPRVYGSLALAGAAGVPLVRIWCDALTGETTTAKFAGPGYRYRWEDADFLRILWHLANAESRSALAIARPRPRTVHAHLSATDPLPLVARLVLMGRHAGARAAELRRGPVRAEDPSRVLWAPRRRARPPGRRSGPESDLRVAVIGAGPYGLSAAAFCRSAGATVQTFGRVMEFWSTRMPDGMILRSRWRSSHIADPTGTLGLDAYERVIGRALPDHIAIADFIEYGRWYQRQAVPELDQRLVRRLESTGTGFRLTLDDGAIHDSHAVILATGLEPFPHRPSPFSALPPELVSHSVDHRSLSGFRGKSVLVVGAGQSALEGAALLREIGARVEVIARASELAFLAPEEIVGAVQRLNLAMRPPTDVGGRLTGWIAAAPDLFRTLPSGVRSRVGTRVVRPRGADWLRPRLAGVAVTLGRRPVAATAEDGRIRVALDDGTERQVDHVLLGTGYRMDVASYEFFDQELVGRLALRDGYPLLGPGLESSVPGLHFVGAPAALSFGPIMRFVVGTWYAAPAVAERVTRVRRRLLRLSYRPRRRDTGRSTARASLPDASGNGTHGGKATAVARSGSRPGS